MTDVIEKIELMAKEGKKKTSKGKTATKTKSKPKTHKQKLRGLKSDAHKLLKREENLKKELVKIAEKKKAIGEKITQTHVNIRRISADKVKRDSKGMLKMDNAKSIFKGA
jgi:predicted  nucleic acid-binding Zn-ribbon protein